MSRFQARLAGVFYLLTIVVGVFTAFAPSKPLSDAGSLMGTAFYVVVTILLYLILKPVSPALSLMRAWSALPAALWGPLKRSIAPLSRFMAS